MTSLSDQFDAIVRADKFADGDAAYLKRRKTFAETMGTPALYDYIDHFGLFVGVQTLATRLAIYEIFKTTLDVPGHVVEFGCWKGANLLFLAKVLSILRPNTIKKILGFDSFEGLKTFAKADGDAANRFAGQYQGNENLLRQAIGLFGMQDWVHLVKGDARETIPAFSQAFPHTMVSFAYVDFDLYEPSRAALEFVGPRLSKGGVIVMDEALTEIWQGEGVALREFLEKQMQSQFDLHAVPHARQPTVYLVKL
jgi:hypothetical protein